MEFRERSYELRRQKGLSQEELANRLDVTRQTISKWEAGDSAPDMEKLAALSEEFGVSLDELVLGKVPVTTRLDALGDKVLTRENKERAKKGAKILGIILAAVLAVDVISMIVYFLAFGFPK
ncbi:MAG: helix-turn-helix transcriptional regulator [Oscillospiraceae bacterium]|nr:helix-turn-helix transcriptional regulator [Oscillospiraceae bacterium]